LYVSTSNETKTDPIFSNAYFGNLSSSSHPTCEGQEERSRLSAWYSIWRHQSNNQAWLCCIVQSARLFIVIGKIFLPTGLLPEYVEPSHTGGGDEELFMQST